MMTIKAKIIYKIKKTHPDIEYIKDWKPRKIYTLSDTYRIDPDAFWGRDAIFSFIKEDLRLVAGGGYNSDHIYDVSFDFSW